MAHILFHLLDEEDDIFAQSGVGIGSEDGRERAEIAAHQGSGGVSGNVERIGRDFVFGDGTGEDIPQECA